MAITNAQLAQQVSELMDYWRTRDLQFAEWLSGSPSGGPYGDGRYPLSDYLGVIQYLFCPAALESGVTSSASSAALSAALAGASKDEALLAQAAAVAAQNQALANRDDARAARDLALQYRDESANNMSTAATHRAKAKAWASNTVDVVVESGLYSALHYATKASEAYANLTDDLAAATLEAVADATASATASASAAAQSADDADDARNSTEAARDITLGYKTDAANSAVAAAASAAAAATFDPAVYIRKDIAQIVAGQLTLAADLIPDGTGLVDVGSSARRFRDVYVSGGLRDAGANGYLVNTTGTTAVYGGGSTWTALSLGGTLTVNKGGDTRTSGKIQSTGWNGSYVAGHGIAIGISGDSAYVHSYNSTTSTYPRLYLAASTVELTSNSVFAANGKNTIQTSDAWLRLNQAGHYTSGVHIPGNLNVGTNIEVTGGDCRVAGGFRWYSDTAYYIYNTSGYSYGSWRIGGARGGYTGVMLDTSAQPTLMSAGSNVGVYMQGAGYWSWYDTGSGGVFQIQNPLQTASGYGYLRYGDTFGQGRVYVRNGGSAVGSQEGDITLIW